MSDQAGSKGMGEMSAEELLHEFDCQEGLRYNQARAEILRRLALVSQPEPRLTCICGVSFPSSNQEMLALHDSCPKQRFINNKCPQCGNGGHYHVCGLGHYPNINGNPVPQPPATRVPGICGKHAIITLDWRNNRGPNGAFIEAVARLKAEYDAALLNDLGMDIHLVLTVAPSVGEKVLTATKKGNTE